MRSNSKQRLRAANELATFIRFGGDAKEFMSQFHPEDAVLINDMAFAELYNSNVYSINQADADCLPFLVKCSPEFTRARKEMGQGLLCAFDAWNDGGNDVI